MRAAQRSLRKRSRVSGKSAGRTGSKKAAPSAAWVCSGRKRVVMVRGIGAAGARRGKRGNHDRRRGVVDASSVGTARRPQNIAGKGPVMKRYRFSAVSAAALVAGAAGRPRLRPGLQRRGRGGPRQARHPGAAVETLTTEQVAQITNVLALDRHRRDRRRRGSRRSSADEATATGRLGVAQLRSSVAERPGARSASRPSVDTLTLSQLGQIENVDRRRATRPT